MMAKNRVKNRSTIIKLIAGTKIELIKSLRAYIDQNKVQGPKSNFLQNWRDQKCTQPFLKPKLFRLVALVHLELQMLNLCLVYVDG
jgi:hypothetical protein